MSFGQEMRDFANAFNSGVDSYANLERARNLRTAKDSGKFDFAGDFFKNGLGLGGGDDSDDGGNITPAELKPKAAPTGATTAVNPQSLNPPPSTAAPYVPPADPNQSPGAYQHGGPVVPGVRRVQGMNQRPLPSGIMATPPPRPRFALPVTQMGNGLRVRPSGNIARGYDNGGSVSNISYAFQDGGSADDQYPDDYDQPPQQPDVNLIAPNDRSVPYTPAPQGNTPPPAQPLPPPSDQPQMGARTAQPPGPSSAQPAPQPTPSGALPTAPVNPAVLPSRGTAGPSAATPQQGGLLPITDEDGYDRNGKSRLSRALDGGIRYLQDVLGLNQALPGGGVNQRGLARLMAGDHSADMASVQSAMNAVDPQHKLPLAMRVIKTMKDGYDYYLMQGNYQAANAYAASLIQYTVGVSEQYGQDALDYLNDGNQQAAVQSLIRGAEHVPNGQHATDPKFNKDGTVTVNERDTESGRVIGTHTLSPEDLYAAATGMANKSLAWQRIMSAAATRKDADIPVSGDEAAAQDYLDKMGQPGGTPAAGGTTPAAPSGLPAGSPDQPVPPGGVPAAPPQSATPAQPTGAPAGPPDTAVATGDVERPSDLGGADVGQGAAAPTPAPAPTGVKYVPKGTKGAVAYYGETGDDFPNLPDNVSPDVKAALRTVPAELRPIVDALAQHEPDQPYNAKSVYVDPKTKKKGATGLFQFEAGTWGDTTKKKIDPTLKDTDKDPRLDPKQSVAAVVDLTRNNISDLTNRLGKTPTYADVTVAHQQGAAATAAMLKADPNMKVGDLYKQLGINLSNLTNNHVDPNGTVAQALDHIKKTYGAPDVPMGGPQEERTVAPGSPAAVAASTKPWNNIVENADPFEKGLGVKGVLPQDQEDMPVKPTPPQIQPYPTALVSRLTPEKQRIFLAQYKQKYGQILQGYNAEVKQYQADLKAWRQNKLNAPPGGTYKDATDVEGKINEALGAPDGGKIPTDRKNAIVDNVWGTNKDTGKKNFDTLSPDAQDGVRDIAGDLMQRNPFSARKALQLTHDLTYMGKSSSKPPFQIYATPGGNAYHVYFNSGESAYISKAQLGQIYMMRHESWGVANKAEKDAKAAAARPGEGGLLGQAVTGTGLLASEGVHAVGEAGVQGARAVAPVVGRAISGAYNRGANAYGQSGMPGAGVVRGAIPYVNAAGNTAADAADWAARQVSPPDQPVPPPYRRLMPRPDQALPTR